MRINSHCHIFNFQSVFTTHTLDILINRIKEWKLPGFVEEAITKEVSKVIKKVGKYTDEDELMRNIFSKIKKSTEYKKLINELTGNEKLELVNLKTDTLDNIAQEGLRQCFSWLGKKLFKDEGDAKKSSITDMIDFVRIALFPSIRKVTEHLMGQLKTSDAIIALMMDITKDGSGKQLFENQLKDTAEMVLTYPGRVFPLVAVNSNRPDHFQIMEHALNGGGFVGVKLYPSLGYDIDTPVMDKVYSYCEERNIPLLMHCTNIGFYYKEEFRINSDPDIWKPVLARHPNLKICFGHFGGAENLTGDSIPGDSWTGKILKLMESYKGVYADISYHTEPMDGGNKQINYFKNINELLNNDLYKNNLLFGTDFFLVRQRLKEKNYWKFYEKHFSEINFKKITRENPPQFLGMMEDDPKPNQALINQVRFIYNNRTRIENKVHPWLAASVKKIFGNTAKFPLPTLGAGWAWNNDAHFRTWSFMKRQMSDSQKNLKFQSTAKLRLRQFQYWNKEFEAVDIWKQKLRKISEDIDAEFRANGAKYETGFDSAKALESLAGEFNKGDLKLYELAAICDRIYLFKKEGD